MKSIKIKKHGEFTIYYIPQTKEYYGVRIVTKEMIKADSLEEIEKIADSYREESAKEFSKMAKDAGFLI